MCGDVCVNNIEGEHVYSLLSGESGSRYSELQELLNDEQKSNQSSEEGMYREQRPQKCNYNSYYMYEYETEDTWLFLTMLDVLRNSLCV